METISVKLLTSVRPRGPAAIGLNSQEQLVSDHWFSALNLSEDPAVCTHIAGTGLESPSASLMSLCLCLTAQPDSFHELVNRCFE